MSIILTFPEFNPFENENGGTVVAIAGNDFAIIGADTRLSTDTTIRTRSQKKLFQLSPVTTLGATGCWCDVLALTCVVKARMGIYEYENGKPMSSPAAAQMLSTIMYFKRFFPYLISSVLAGLDADGVGCVFTFDAVGHFSRSTHSAVGSAGHQLQSVLDNQISKNNIQNPSKTPLSTEDALSLLKDLFTAAAERDIHTGDSVNIVTMSKKDTKISPESVEECDLQMKIAGYTKEFLLELKRLARACKIHLNNFIFNGNLTRYYKI